MPDRHPSDDIIPLYERHARDFIAERGTTLFEKPWLDRFLALLPAGASILDVGCGSARPIARYFIEQGHPVTGIDSSPTLIAACAQAFPAHAWLVADMRTLSLGRRFDGLIAWHSLFHLTPDDQRRTLRALASHAAPRAALMFTSGPAHGEAIGSWHGHPLYHGSLDPAEYRSLLAVNGFDVIAHTVEDPTCGGATIWLARMTNS